MVVNHRCQQVVRRADCMEITCEMKVDVFHRNHLCVSASCSAAFHTKDRSKGRLAKSNHNLLAELLHTICQTYGRSGLALSCRSRVDCGNENQLAVGSVRLFQQIVVDLCFVLAVLLQILVIDPCFCCDLSDRSHLTFLCDLDVGFESHKNYSFLPFGPAGSCQGTHIA